MKIQSSPSYINRLSKMTTSFLKTSRTRFPAIFKLDLLFFYLDPHCFAPYVMMSCIISLYKVSYCSFRTLAWRIVASYPLCYLAQKLSACIASAISAYLWKWLGVTRNSEKQLHGGTKGLNNLFQQKRRHTKPSSMTGRSLLYELGTLWRKQLQPQQ